MDRTRRSLILGTYMGAVFILTIPAMLLLIDRNVPTAWAILLGMGLAHIAVIALVIVGRIYLAFRESRKNRNSN